MNLNPLSWFRPKAEMSYEGMSWSNIWNSVAGWMRKTISGETVSPGKAMTLSTWYACIRNIAEDIGKLPLVVYKFNADGKGKKLDKTSALYWLLRFAPNPEMNSGAFRETITGWALGWGNGYAEIQWGSDGQPVALWPIHPSRANLHRVDGEIVLDVLCGDANDPAGARAVRLPYRDVLHIRGLGDHPLLGLSVAQLAAESIGISLAAQTFGAAFFGNGATPALALVAAGKLDEAGQTLLRESWKKRHGGGAGNSNSVAVLQNGMKIEKLTVSPEEAQFIETRQFQVPEICKWFRMPPHMVQDLSRATFSNIEHLSIEYVTNALMPWLNRWEEECERKLLRDRRSIEGFDIKHLVQSLLRGDNKTRSEFYGKMIGTGVMTPNEAREAEDLDPDPSPAAGKLYMQGAMAPLDLIAEGRGMQGTDKKTAKPTDDEEDPDKPEKSEPVPAGENQK